MIPTKEDYGFRLGTSFKKKKKTRFYYLELDQLCVHGTHI